MVYEWMFGSILEIKSLFVDYLIVKAQNCFILNVLTLNIPNEISKLHFFKLNLSVLVFKKYNFHFSKNLLLTFG